MMTTIEAAQRENVLVFTIRYTERKHGQLTARNKYGMRVVITPSPARRRLLAARMR